MAHATDLAAASRDATLTLRRVERQQRLVEILVDQHGVPRPTEHLARSLGVSERTVERDLARLRDSGLPIRSKRGPGGGSWLVVPRRRTPIEFDIAELAALTSTLVALGPTATDSAASAMRKLVSALTDVSPADRIT